MHNTQDMCPPSHHPETEDDQLRLLLVDDDPVVRQMMVSMVENWNHEPHAAPNAEGALELLEQMPVDVVVTVAVLYLFGAGKDLTDAGNQRLLDGILAHRPRTWLVVLLGILAGAALPWALTKRPWRRRFALSQRLLGCID